MENCKISTQAMPPVYSAFPPMNVSIPFIAESISRFSATPLHPMPIFTAASDVRAETGIWGQKWLPKIEPKNGF